MIGSLLPLGFGLIIGLALGAIGGGGSILTVPILVSIMGQDAHAATATSLAVVGATALAGAIPHWRAGRVSFSTALPFGVAGIGGAFAGAWLNQRVPGWLILTLFGTLMLVVAANMYRTAHRPPPVRGGSDDVAAPLSTLGVHPWNHALRVVTVGLGVGLLTGFLGVGGGFLIVPALVLVLGFPMRLAVGTSLVIIAINSASGLAAHLRYGALDTTLTLLFVIGGILGALTGARLSCRIDEQRLQRGFALLIALVGLWLTLDTLL